VSLGVGGALAADGGESLQKALFSEEVRTAYPLAYVMCRTAAIMPDPPLLHLNGMVSCTHRSKLGGSVFLGTICGGLSGLFEFMRIAKVISAAKGEPFSITQQVCAAGRARNGRAAVSRPTFRLHCAALHCNCMALHY
jgi:hypothetical protein